MISTNERNKKRDSIYDIYVYTVNQKLKKKKKKEKKKANENWLQVKRKL